jgi:aminopeptidase N
MKRIAFLNFFMAGFVFAFSQAEIPPPGVSKEYRATAEKINDLVHTKLDAKFDYSKSQMMGKVWITLQPHFYPTDSLRLDAKAMDIHSLALVKNGRNSPLKYDYDGMFLKIHLDKTYRSNEKYTIYIDYTAKPNEYKGQGSAAITDAKGLYFINPTGEDKNKPTEIWTQGETESNSVWVPTIDKPNQKQTDEILMTVPSKYVTLSNGKLVSQKNNGNGTRTDDWKMDLPHSPYLMFMGVGDYAVIKDKYKNKEVSYYVEKQYATVARKIFGKTPEMIALYSKLTGVDFPWVKYSQITGRDYVSGAMENTTSTLHSDAAQQDARELTDGNRWESVIAHELFHQWFGDYVTTESWSNITLNESFATLGSQLWNEFHYGKDFGDEERYNSAQGYFHSGSENKDLVRFYYNDKEDVFDAVSYNKGGAILQMLRNFVGDSAFFKALHLYLTTYKFKAAEAQELRLAFEEITGKDLTWFWNQWYYGSGHPKLKINYSYDNNAKQARVIVEQTTDKTFMFPVKIDVWNGSVTKTYSVWVKNKIDTFSFYTPSKPSLINFDADKKLLAEKTENKTLDEYFFQYKNAKNYVDRREAIDAAAQKQTDATASEILLAAFKDRYAPLRTRAINLLDISNEQVKNTAEPILFELAKNETNRPAKAAAIAKLGNYRSNKYNSLFKDNVNDSSYTVSGNALEALYRIDSSDAISDAKRLSAKPAKGRLERVIQSITNPVSGEQLLSEFEALPLGQPKFNKLNDVFDFMSNTSSNQLFKRGVDDILKLENDLPEAFRAQATEQLNNALRQLQKQKAEAGFKEQADYIESKLPKAKD